MKRTFLSLGSSSKLLQSSLKRNINNQALSFRQRWLRQLMQTVSTSEHLRYEQWNLRNLNYNSLRIKARMWGLNCLSWTVYLQLFQRKITMQVLPRRFKGSIRTSYDGHSTISQVLLPVKLTSTSRIIIDSSRIVRTGSKRKAKPLSERSCYMRSSSITKR